MLGYSSEFLQALRMAKTGVWCQITRMKKTTLRMRSKFIPNADSFDLGFNS